MKEFEVRLTKNTRPSTLRSEGTFMAEPGPEQPQEIENLQDHRAENKSKSVGKLPLWYRVAIGEEPQPTSREWWERIPREEFVEGVKHFAKDQGIDWEKSELG